MSACNIPHLSKFAENICTLQMFLKLCKENNGLRAFQLIGFQNEDTFTIFETPTWLCDFYLGMIPFGLPHTDPTVTQYIRILVSWQMI